MLNSWAISKFRQEKRKDVTFEFFLINCVYVCVIGLKDPTEYFFRGDVSKKTFFGGHARREKFGEVAAAEMIIRGKEKMKLDGHLEKEGEAAASLAMGKDLELKSGIELNKTEDK